jgi:hypothetical protein
MKVYEFNFRSQKIRKGKISSLKLSKFEEIYDQDVELYPFKYRVHRLIKCESRKEFEELKNTLMTDRDFYKNSGGTFLPDELAFYIAQDLGLNVNDFTDEHFFKWHEDNLENRKMVDCMKWDRIIKVRYKSDYFLVDTQGYNYAKYVGL